MNVTTSARTPAAQGLQYLFGGAPLVLGATLLALAWLMPAASQRQLPSALLIGLNTALCFVLCGIGLLSTTRRSLRARRLRCASGLAVLVIASLPLLQSLAGFFPDGPGLYWLLNHGADPRPAAGWPADSRFSASIGLLLTGLSLVLLTRARSALVALVPCLGMAVVGSALILLFDSLLDNVLFKTQTPVPLLLPAPTAAALVALGLGLSLASARSPLFRGFYREREDRRIFCTGFALFALVSLVTGLTGIAIVGRYAMRHYQEAHMASFAAHAALFRDSLDAATARSGDIVRLSGLGGLVARRAAPAELQAELERLLRTARFDELRSLKVVRHDGSTAAQVGTENFSGQFSVALAARDPARLYWDGGWRVRTAVALAPDGSAVLAEVALRRYDQQYAQVNQQGRSGELRICSAEGASMRCFPSRLAPLPTAFPLHPAQRPLAMNLALNGERGVASQRDYRGAEVIAAYGLMEGTGIGLVEKIDADEFYQPLRRRLWYAVGGIALLILAGASALYWRTRPLVQRLVDAGARLDSILASVPAGVLTIDRSARICSANRAAEAMFGYAAGQMIGLQAGALLAPQDGAPRQMPARGEHQLAGRRSDGALFQMALNSAQFMLGQVSKQVVVVADITEAQRAAQTLKRSEASLADAQRIARLGSWERDAASGAQEWSDETSRIFERAPGAAAPDWQALEQLVHPDDRADWRQAAASATPHDPRYQVSFRVQLPSGRIKVLHVRALAEFGADGKPLRLRGTLQDITAMSRTEALLHKREEQYRALVENLPDVVIRFDREARCVYVNRALGQAAGLQPVIVFGKPPQEVAQASAPASAWCAAIGAVFASGRTHTFDVAYALADGVRHYQVRLVREFRQAGKAGSVLALARDITLIRGGEAVLRESEQLLYGITANMPGMVFQCGLAADGALAFTYVSEGAAALFGLAPAAILADPCVVAALIADADRARFRASLAQAARSMEVLDWEGRAERRDGTPIWINCRATPRAAGGCTILEGVMFNITASKRNEEEIVRSRQLLRELSAHMESVREEERKKIAREVHDELGQALTALRMDVSLLRLNFGAASPQLMERIRAMKEAVDQTIGIVRHVTTSLRPAALDLGLTAALEWLVEDVGRRSGVRCLLDAGGGEVVLDDSQATALFRIVQESLTNVLKHAGASEVRVTLGVDGDQVRLELCDDGVGFAAGDPAEAGKFGLMGMRERTLMLGGTLDIRSSPGAGTCVLVRLPLHECEHLKAADA